MEAPMAWRWQAWVRALDGVAAGGVPDPERPEPACPEGWRPSGDDRGAWHPVAASSCSILWRRLLQEQPKRAEQVGLELAGEGLPEWARSLRLKGATRGAMVAMVLACIGEITQRPVNPDRCKGAALEVLKLWRSLGRPDPAEFLGQVSLVALAARESRARLFARDIRGIGWEDAVDRSRSVSTLTVARKFEERLQAAQEWQARQVATVPDEQPRGPSPRGGFPTMGS